MSSILIYVVNINCYYYYYYYYYYCRGNLGAVRLMLQYLPPTCTVDIPKDDGFTALHLATLNNHLEVAKIIIQHVN